MMIMKILQLQQINVKMNLKNNTVMYKSLLEMVNDLQYKYFVRKSRQNKITEYFMQK